MMIFIGRFFFLFFLKYFFILISMITIKLFLHLQWTNVSRANVDFENLKI